MKQRAKISVTKAIAPMLWLLVSSLAVPYFSLAQTGAGSATADNSKVIIAPETVELRFSETTYFGPNAHWEINGTLEIWSRNIWIAPTARFSGTGKIIIHDPGTNPFYEDMPAGPTQIDGNNGLPIDVAMELRNPHNLLLNDIDDPGYHTSMPGSRPQAAALHLNNRFEFAVDNGDILLNGHDLLVGAEGSLHGYNRDRMIVTGNNIASHVVKTYSTSVPFTFPVGIAESDYTPATLSPAVATTLHVGVQDYQASNTLLTTPQKEAGIDRMWHIYANEAVYTAYTLQHNSVTNGSAYVDERAQLMQYAGSGNWLGGNTQRIAQGIHARDWVTATAGTGDGSWLTKLITGNRGPDAMDDETEGPSGRRLTVVVLENDLPGHSPIVVNRVRVVVQPKNGTVSVNADGSVTYVSTTGYIGDDSFVYGVTDENGLADFATVRITVRQAELLIPNAVTPNSDGKNDLFVIQGLENYDSGDLTIFNRWGNEVYRSRNYKQNWDAAGVSEGTYYYRLVLIKGGLETIHKGWVLVKR